MTEYLGDAGGGGTGISPRKAVNNSGSLGRLRQAQPDARGWISLTQLQGRLKASRRPSPNFALGSVSPVHAAKGRFGEFGLRSGSQLASYGLGAMRMSSRVSAPEKLVRKLRTARETDLQNTDLKLEEPRRALAAYGFF